MEPVEEDKFSNVESQSVRSSQSQLDTPNDLMRIIEENYQRFNDILNQNAPADSNLEKELAKEDKKCTSLQYRIENLKQRYNDAKEISASLQKSVRDQQMEIEKVSAVIYEQLQQLHSKFPPDGLTQYSNAVSVISNAGVWVKNLKNMLQRDVEECKKKTEKILQQKQSVSLLMSRIQKLIAEKSHLEEISSSQTHTISKTEFGSFETYLSLLHEKFDTYQNLKLEHSAKKTELEELKKKKIEVSNECQKMNETSFQFLNKYNQIIVSSRKQISYIKQQQLEFENFYDQLMTDFNLLLTQLTRESNKLSDDITLKKQDLDKLVAMKQTSDSECKAILSEMEQHKLEYSKVEKVKTITFCREEEKMTKITKETIVQQIDVLKTTNVNSKFLLEQLAQKVETMEQEFDSSIVGLEDYSAEDLQQKINQEQTEVECNLENGRKLTCEIFELKQVVRSSTDSNNELKNALKLSQTESSFLRQLVEKSENEFKETHEQQLAAIHQSINKALKDMTNAYCASSEKQLLIDSLQDDICKYTKLVSEMQHQVWATNQKNENLWNEKTQLETTISREYEAIEGKKKLLDDLEKNSFPKNKIPVNWFKSFEKQKQEYDTLVKQRLELEKKRNQLIIETDSQAFQTKECETSDIFESPNKRSSSDVKNAMYDIFKERVRKRKSTSLRT